MLVIVMLAMLVAVSSWVWRDAARRGMSPRWAIGVGLLLIVVLPIYLLVRKPVKCKGCGKAIPAALSLCEECERVQAEQEGDGAARAGRIFG